MCIGISALISHNLTMKLKIEDLQVNNISRLSNIDDAEASQIRGGDSTSSVYSRVISLYATAMQASFELHNVTATSHKEKQTYNKIQQ